LTLEYDEAKNRANIKKHPKPLRSPISRYNMASKSNIRYTSNQYPRFDVTRRGLRGYKDEKGKPSNQAKSIVKASVGIGAAATLGR